MHRKNSAGVPADDGSKSDCGENIIYITDRDEACGSESEREDSESKSESDHNEKNSDEPQREDGHAASSAKAKPFVREMRWQLDSSPRTNESQFFLRVWPC